MGGTQPPEGDSSRGEPDFLLSAPPPLSGSFFPQSQLLARVINWTNLTLARELGQRPSSCPPSPAPKVRTMPAYCIAIGIGHRHEWRAESPVSSGGSGRGLGVSGLQPSGSIITSSTQAAGLGFLIVRLWRAGKGAAPHHGKPVHARPPRPLPPSAPAADNPFPLPIFPSPFAFIGLYSRFSPSRPRANGPA